MMLWYQAYCSETSCVFFLVFFLSDLPIATQYQEMHIISKKKGDALVYKQIDNYYSTVTQHQIKL